MTVSLRTRLLGSVIIGTTLLLGIFCIILYTLTRNMVTHQFDRSLLSTAKMLSAVVENEGVEDEEDDDDDDEDDESHERGYDYRIASSNLELEFEFDVRMTPEFNHLHGGGYYQLWNRDRTFTLRSPSLGKSNLTYFANNASEPLYQRCQLPDNKPGRAVSYTFLTAEKEDHAQLEQFTFIVARDASTLYDFLGFFRWLLLGCSAAIVLLSGLVAATVARIGLRPVHTLADEIESVDEKNPQHFFSTENCPAELAPICDRLNALMERIQQSLQQQRRFNADVAHELRTPLAGIQSTIEVCLSRDRQAQEYQQALENSLAITQTMNRLVGTLLALSRLEAEQIPLETQTITLKEQVERTWLNFADQAHDKGLTFENHIDDALTCVTDRDHFGMIISNLLENAVEYVNEQGQIIVSAKNRDRTVELSISNTGSDLAPDDLEHIFEFFWRADTARTHTGTHCGIGLAVVQKVAAILGMRLNAKIDQPKSTFTITLELPTAPQ